MSYLTLWNNRQLSPGWPSVFAGLDEQLESLFGGLPSAFEKGASAYPAPVETAKARWYEKPDAYLLRVDLPGLKAKDIEIKWDEGVLSLSAERKFEDGAKGQSSQKIVKSYKVPKEVDVNKVGARYEDGVLSLTLPKNEKARPRHIEVKGR